MPIPWDVLGAWCRRSLGILHGLRAVAKHCPSYRRQFVCSPGASRHSVAPGSAAWDSYLVQCPCTTGDAGLPVSRGAGSHRAGTWPPRAAALVLRDVLVEAGRYVEIALLFLCQNWLWSGTAALVQRCALANSPELARLCAVDNLSLDNLASKSWEPVALVNLRAQKSVEVEGMTWWCPEHLLERAGGVKQGVPEVAEMYHGLQKNTKIEKHTL